MSDKMIPGSEEHTNFMRSVLVPIKNLRDRVLNKYKGDDRGVADGWFIAMLVSLAITLGKKGGLNNTQLRAVFEMYLDTIEAHPDAPQVPINPQTIINRE